MEEDGYCRTISTMLSSVDVLKSGELKKLKINREYDFLIRSINYMNYCGTHKCSSHCTMPSIIEVLYNKETQQYIDKANIVTENNKSHVELKNSHRRMTFGKLRIFDSSGENNLTRGIPFDFFKKYMRY